MNCKEAKSLLTNYLLGDLGDTLASAIRAHIETCENCSAEAAEIQPTLDLLRDALSDTASAPAKLDVSRHAAIYQNKSASKGKVVAWLFESHPHAARAAAVFLAAAFLWIVTGEVMWRSTGEKFCDTGADLPGACNNPLAGPLRVMLPEMKMGEVVYDAPKGDGDTLALYSKSGSGGVKDYNGGFEALDEPVPLETIEELEDLVDVTSYGGVAATPAAEPAMLAGNDSSYRVNAGSLDSRVAVAKVVKKKRIKSTEQPAIVYAIPELDDTEVDSVMDEMTHLSYAVTANAKAGKMGKGGAGGRQGGWPEGIARESNELTGVPATKSPVVMNGVYGSRSPGARGSAIAASGGSRIEPAPQESLSRADANSGHVKEKALNADKFELREESKVAGSVKGDIAVATKGFSSGVEEKRDSRKRELSRQPVAPKKPSSTKSRIPVLGRLFSNERSAKVQPSAPRPERAAQDSPVDALGSNYKATGLTAVSAGVAAEQWSVVAADKGSPEPLDPFAPADMDGDDVTIDDAGFGFADMNFEVQSGSQRTVAVKSLGAASLNGSAISQKAEAGDEKNRAEAEVPGEKDGVYYRYLPTLDGKKAENSVSERSLSEGEAKPESVTVEEGYLNTTQTFFEEGDYSQASKEIEEVLKTDPSNKDALIMRGKLEIEKRNLAEAAELEIGGAVAEPEEPVDETRFKAYGVNPVINVSQNAFSTFSIDVDTASYTLARKYIENGSLPPAEAVRTEEIVNFFDYDYKAPVGRTFAVYAEVAPSKFGRGQHLLKIGVKGKRLGREEQRRAVLTFMVDTSGSMETDDRIGLVKKSLKMLVGKLGDEDLVSIVQYDSRARLVLAHTKAASKKEINAAIDSLQCSGSTNLEQGMNKAYEAAANGFVSKGENRVLILSDGVANLGDLDAEALLEKVGKYRKQGIYCSVFGVGMGAYDDVMLETLANKGDGTYAYLDSEEEAKRLFVDDLAATLNTIASDVKIQVEFNRNLVKTYRQLGYENRQLKKEQFRDNTVDAGEVGSGQSVTALYEMDLQNVMFKGASQKRLMPEPVATVRVRYRRSDNDAVEEIEIPVTFKDFVNDFNKADVRFRLAACAAEFAEILRGSPYAQGSDYRDVSRVLAPVALELNLDQRVQGFLQLTTSAPGMARGK